MLTLPSSAPSPLTASLSPVKSLLALVQLHCDPRWSAPVLFCVSWCLILEGDECGRDVQTEEGSMNWDFLVFLLLCACSGALAFVLVRTCRHFCRQVSLPFFPPGEKKVPDALCNSMAIAIAKPW